ncbi:YceI family protein [uncultured Roseovarius sp.]|uniref:YceI family protein n=1 Tax=uncultured Roseovarius sp. TaxID=293344 RepID=UPI0026171094|nr:YceI family protein [uncultured Roseovarius sp.]
MTGLRLTALGTTLAFGVAHPVQAEPATWQIDPEHAVVAFTIMHAGYAKVLGRFSQIEGSFTYDPETQDLGKVTATIGTPSIDTDHEQRDTHVRSPDFLDAEAHPMITFTAEGGTPISDTAGTVSGDLTIRGVTQPITLDVTLNKRAVYPCCHGKETLGISATAEILRSAFGSTYALPDFVGDSVNIILEFEAIRAD